MMPRLCEELLDRPAGGGRRCLHLSQASRTFLYVNGIRTVAFITFVMVGEGQDPLLTKTTPERTQETSIESSQ